MALLDRPLHVDPDAEPFRILHTGDTDDANRTRETDAVRLKHFQMHRFDELST